MATAIYLRLSEADGDLGVDGKDESNSIENQRKLLRNFVESRDDLPGEVIEYADDGYSGTNFNRPAFLNMIEDAKKGKVQVVVVKDLSRLGRDYITAGDYIEQIFPMLQVRFIAVNNGYDSGAPNGMNAGFDVAISNLINTFYSRDLSRKLKASNEVRWKKGISTSGNAPFGYVKSSDEKGKFVKDPDAAKIVRRVFDLALEGKNTTEIAFILNEEKLPTPYVYNQIKKNWKLAELVTAESERLWDASTVGRVLKKYDYTGAMVMGRKRSLTVGAKRGKLQPESEWTVVEGIHEPIVTHEEFELANQVIRQRKKVTNISENDYLLKGKIRCGNCRRALYYEDTGRKESYLCRHGRQIGKHSSCCTEEYPVAHIDEIVWNALKDQIATLEALGLKAKEKADKQMKSAKRTQKSLSTEIEKLKAEKLRQYEFYAEGNITKEEYIRRKKELGDLMEQLEQDRKAQGEEYERQSELLESANTISTMAHGFSGERKLSRPMVEAFIENVYVYDANRVEIIFRHEDEIAKLTESLDGAE